MKYLPFLVTSAPKSDSSMSFIVSSPAVVPSGLDEKVEWVEPGGNTVGDISFSFAQIILGKFQREKTIAFTTSAGQVTISLSAVEDLIRRLAGIIPEVKELRPNAVANKKGIIVEMRVVLRSEANIPELTSRLQDITKSKIQEVLGVDEQIIIRIHVAKIAHRSEERRVGKEC